MEKRDYEKPTMQVVKLQQRCRILSGSKTKGENYEWD